MKYDIAIIGGGMVGAALAVALQDTPYKILLIDAATPHLNTQDPRLIGLNHQSCEFLKEIHIFDALKNFTTPIKQIHISHRKHFGTAKVNADELGLSELGVVAPAKYINQAIYQTLESNKIKLLQAAKLCGLTQHETYIQLDIKTGENTESFECTLVIGADGTHSTVRKLLQIPVTTHDYHESAIVTTTTLTRHHHNIAYERFLQSGAIAMLPLNDQQCATIWTDTQEKITALMQQDDELFLQNLQTEFGYRLGRLTHIDKRHVFPLQMILSKQQAKKNIILIGNAAHTLYPIASQGLNLALHEVAALSELIRQSETLQPFNHLAYLNAVEKQQTTSLRLSHHLSWIFTSKFPLLSCLRKFSLLGFDILLPLKKEFARRAIRMH